MAHVREMIVSLSVHDYFKSNKLVVIRCFPSRLCAALLQEEHLVTNSSVVMTQMQTEQNHANVEKDLLAIAYACDIFNQDIYGRSNVIAEQP